MQVRVIIKTEKKWKLALSLSRKLSVMLLFLHVFFESEKTNSDRNSEMMCDFSIFVGVFVYV